LKASSAVFPGQTTDLPEGDRRFNTTRWSVILASIDAKHGDTRVIYATPAFSYTITGTPDPVAPGQVLEYGVTVTNLSAVAQVVQVDFAVPEYTTYGSLAGGNASYYYFGSVGAGQSSNTQLLFAVVGSGSIPPDGTSITLDLIDLGRGASVSRTVVVDSAAP
jgi:hypothetical protein